MQGVALSTKCTARGERSVEIVSQNIPKDHPLSALDLGREYSLEFFSLKISVDFVKMLSQNLEFIIDARSGWKLNHENFICKNFLF